MLRHYLTTALVHFRRYKVTTLINILCLAIGLVCFLAAHWMVTSMASSDRHFPGWERIYVVTQKITVSGSEGSIPTMPLTALRAGPAIRENIPELEVVARSTMAEQQPIKTGAIKTFVQAKYVDPEFLDVFAFRFLAGDDRAALAGPNSAVITEPTAVRLFGSVDKAIGSRFLLQGNHDVTITGVIEPVAAPSHMESGDTTNSSLQFDALISMDVYETRAHHNTAAKYALEAWNVPIALTYLVLPRDGSMTADALSYRLRSFGERHIPAVAGRYEFDAVPLPQLGLSFLNIVLGTDKTGISSVMVTYLLGGLVLLISCVNYANLAAAQAMARAKEVGMRRVVGARRRQIIAQHLLEAGLQSFMALLIATALVALTLASGDKQGDAFVASLLLKSPAFWIFLPALWLTVMLAAGAYPAWLLSRISPVQAVRGSRSSEGPGRTPAVLVGAQFGMASFLLIAILIMETQNRNMTQAALGSVTHSIVVLPGNPQAAGVSFDVLRSALLAQPHIEAVTGSVTAPWSTSGPIARVSVSPEKQANRWTVSHHMVHHDFFETLRFQLLAGRVFDRNRANDVDPSMTGSPGVTNVVIDRALATQLGWDQPNAAVGRMMYGWDLSATDAPARPMQVIGVVETRPLAVIGVGATSSVYVLTPSAATIPSIRVSTADIPAALREIDSVWDQLAPDVPMKRRFADEIWNEAYMPFRTIVGGFSFVAVLAFVNAVLGLIGMSLHVIGRRTHEIGVRKTLGASGARVFAMLLRDSSKPALIANIVAWPLAFLAAQVYLSLFTTRVSLSLIPFAVGLGMTLLVAWVAVAFQAMRAASLKPGSVLRYE